MIRKVTAILKLMVALMPAAATVGGLTSAITLSAVGWNEGNKALDQFASSSQFEEIKKEKIDALNQQLANDKMTQEEYDSIKGYIESKDFANSEFKANFIDDKEIQALLKDASFKETLSYYMAIPFGAGFLSCILYLFDGFREFFLVRENMQETYWEKKEKEKKRKERLLKEYSEEIMGE